MVILLNIYNNQGESGVLDWDAEAGTLSGYRAEWFMSAAEEARAAGYIHIGYGGIYTEADPLKTREGLAALLALHNYQCPELSNDLPVADDGDEASDVELVY